MENFQFVAFVGGIILIFSGIGGWRSAVRSSRMIDELLRTGRRAQAPVIGYKTTRAGANRARTVQIPIVRLTTARGVVEPAILSVSEYPPTTVGEVRAVSYNPDQPSQVIITDGTGGPRPASSGRKAMFVAEAVGGVVLLILATRWGSIFPGG